MSKLFETSGFGTGANDFKGVLWASMSYKPLVAHLSRSVILKLYRIGDPTTIGTLTVSLRAVDPVTHKPTGGDLAVAPGLASSGITTDSGGALYTFTWTVPYQMATLIEYAIVCRTSGGDSNNFLQWKYALPSYYSRGYGWRSPDSGTTWNGDFDWGFESWGDGPLFAIAAATGIQAFQVTGNATLDDNTNLDGYGFDWRVYNGTYAAGGSSISMTQPPTGTFSLAITGLDAATLYYYRAKVHHATLGWIYGGWEDMGDTYFITAHDDAIIKRENFNTGDDGFEDMKLNDWKAQSFTPVGHQVRSLVLKLYRSGSVPLGDFTVSIKATDGTGKPTGDDLVSVTRPSNLFTGTPTDYEFGLGDGILLTGSVVYAIVGRCVGGDNNNWIGWRKKGGGGYSGGQYGYSADAGATWTMGSDDLMFEEWGDSGVVTFDASEIRALTAVGNGYLNDATDITEIGFEWGTVSGVYPNEVTDTPAEVSPGIFSLDMTGLSPSTKYYYRAKIYHTTLGWLTGNEVEFTTLPPVPTVRTDPPSDAQTDHIDAVGDIIDEGASDVTRRGFVFGFTSVFGDPGNVAPESSGYTDSEEESGSFSTGSFTLVLAGLQANRVYYLRAWAYNSYGYAYGSEIAVLTNYDVNILFTTSDIALGIRFDTSPGGGYPHPMSGTIPHYRLVRSKDCWFQSNYGYWGALHCGEGVYERHYYNDNLYTDIYGLANPIRRTEGIVKVKWKGRGFCNEYGFSEWRRELKTHGVQYSGSLWPMTLGTQTYGENRCDIFYTNPNTGLAWTLAEADALQAGVTVGHEASFGMSFCDFCEVRVLWANAEVRTDPAVITGATTATLNGFVVQDEAEECVVYFEWGETTGYGSVTADQTDKRIGQFFTADLTGLDPNKTYHFRAVIETPCGETFYGDDAAFDMSHPDRVYVWLGTVADPEHYELTDPALPLALGVRTERGSDEELGHAAAGTAEVTCDNFNGDFSPENAAGAYYGWLILGAVVTVYEIYKGIQYNHFKGKIDKIVPDDNPKEAWAYILAVDGIDDLAATEIDTPLRTTTDAGALVADVLDAVSWPAAQGEELWTRGPTSWRSVGSIKLTAWKLFRNLKKRKRASSISTSTRRPIFENRHHRLLGAHLTSQHDFTDEVVGIEYEYSKRNLRNAVRVTGHKYKVDEGDSDALLWSVWSDGLGAPYIESGGTLELWATFEAPLYSYTTPVANTHWNANSANDGSGTNLTSKVSLAVTQYGQALKLVFTSTANQKAYLVPPTSPPAGAPTDQTVLVYGFLYDESEFTVQKSDGPSIALYGKRSYTVDAHFKANPNDITAYADWLLLRYKTPVPTPVGVKLIARTNWPDDTIRVQCLVRKISDRITLASTRLAFDKDFFINKVIQDYVFLEGGVVHETEWFVESAVGSAEGAFWLLGVVGFSELGETTILGF